MWTMSSPKGVKTFANRKPHRNCPSPSEPCHRNRHTSTRRKSPKPSSRTYTSPFRTLPQEPTLQHAPELTGTFRNLRKHAPELAKLVESSRTHTGTSTFVRNLHWNRHQNTNNPESSGTYPLNLRPEPTPTQTGTLRNLQHTPELSGTVRNLPPAHTGTYLN